MRGKLATADLSIAEIAKRQYGVVSLVQLRGAGLDERAVQRRTATARLHRVHRGVYAVGHASLSKEGRWFASVLAVGRGPHEGGTAILDRWGAAVSHRSAAELWELLPVKSGSCDVSVPGAGGRVSRLGIRVHRPRSLWPAQVTLCRGIPVTAPRRTIADLREAISTHRSGSISARELRKAIRQANVLGLPIGPRDARVRTRSDLEGEFLRLCRRHGLPLPEVNVRIGPYLVDFLWRERWLVVETDSYLYHRGEVAFQDDHARDLELMRRGFEVLRLSEMQLDGESAQVAEILAARLTLTGDAAKAG